jgi:8-oxo-dGTP diphosphatase
MRTGSNRPAQVYRFVERRSDRVFFPRSIAWAERDKADGG